MAIAIAAAFACASPAVGFEGDVHYGLTAWLAIEAGFTPREAETIALADNRVDGGDLQFLDVVFLYACLGTDDFAARDVSQHHYPTAGAVPGAPEQRAVVAGSERARQAINDAVAVPAAQADLMLRRLGEALHALQDSWAHQGVSGVPEVADSLFACDAARTWSHPRARGGSSSHRADLTLQSPVETEAMAKATYDALKQYPPVFNVTRKPAEWEQIRAALVGFTRAATKQEKRAWFASQRITDTGFLAGTSLKDGAAGFPPDWDGRKLPKLASLESTQSGVDPDLLAFYSRFLGDWLSGDSFDALAAAYAVERSPGMRSGTAQAFDRASLSQALKVWRLRDHGAASDLAHAPFPLTSRQFAALDALARPRDALTAYPAPADALFPLVSKGAGGSQVLPFVVRDIAASHDGHRRTAAVLKFRHAPYDALAVVAEKVNDRWRIVAIVATVDH